MRGDLAEYAGVGKPSVGIDDALAAAGVETEPVGRPAGVGGDVDLVILENDGDGVDEIAGGEGELHAVAVGLGLTGQSHRLHQTKGQKLDDVATSQCEHGLSIDDDSGLQKYEIY